MRADLSPAVASACAEAVRPTLVFDRARLAANFEVFAAAARANGVTLLFAAKSFPHPLVWELAVSAGCGFDVGSVEEMRAVPRAAVVSIADPTGRAARAAPVDETRRVIVSCDTAQAIEAVPAHAEIALRVSASITGTDPAVGAVLDGTGHRRSRFGVERDALRALVAAAKGRAIGLHIHHGPVTATSAERFIASANAALALAEEAGARPRFVNLGGAWHGIADIAGALTKIRAALSRELEIIVEPGRALVTEAGFACGTITVARELGDRMLRVSDLSRLCHLRWSPVDLVGVAPHPGAGRKLLVVGPTCAEDDVIGEWMVEPASLPTGGRIVLREVTGYAVAWNTSFGGISAADVVFTDP